MLDCYTLLYMSTLVAVRIPDELLYKVDAKGKRSRVILEALEAYFALPAVTVHPPERLVVTKVDADRKEIHISSLRRPEHNPKECRVYKCGQCAILKAKA